MLWSVFMLCCGPLANVHTGSQTPDVFVVVIVFSYVALDLPTTAMPMTYSSPS